MYGIYQWMYQWKYHTTSLLDTLSFTGNFGRCAWFHLICIQQTIKKNQEKMNNNKKNWSTWNESFFLLVHNTWKTNKLHIAILYAFFFLHAPFFWKHEKAISFNEMSKLKQPNMKMIMWNAWTVRDRSLAHTHIHISTYPHRLPSNSFAHQNQKHKCN